MSTKSKTQHVLQPATFLIDPTPENTPGTKSGTRIGIGRPNIPSLYLRHRLLHPLLSFLLLDRSQLLLLFRLPGRFRRSESPSAQKRLPGGPWILFFCPGSRNGVEAASLAAPIGNGMECQGFLKILKAPLYRIILGLHPLTTGCPKPRRSPGHPLENGLLRRSDLINRRKGLRHLGPFPHVKQTTGRYSARSQNVLRFGVSFAEVFLFPMASCEFAQAPVRRHS